MPHIGPSGLDFQRLQGTLMDLLRLRRQRELMEQQRQDTTVRDTQNLTTRMRERIAAGDAQGALQEFQIASPEARERLSGTLPSGGQSDPTTGVVEGFPARSPAESAALAASIAGNLQSTGAALGSIVDPTTMTAYPVQPGQVKIDPVTGMPSAPAGAVPAPVASELAQTMATAAGLEAARGPAPLSTVNITSPRASPNPSPRTPMAQSLSPYRDLIVTEAQNHGIPPEIGLALASQESNGDPNAQSQVGALGLMQVMPFHASALGLQSPQQLLDPATNVRAGMSILRDFKRRADREFPNASEEDRWFAALTGYNGGNLTPNPNAENQSFAPEVFARVPEAQAFLGTVTPVAGGGVGDSGGVLSDAQQARALARSVGERAALREARGEFTPVEIFGELNTLLGQHANAMSVVNSMRVDEQPLSEAEAQQVESSPFFAQTQLNSSSLRQLPSRAVRDSLLGYVNSLGTRYNVLRGQVSGLPTAQGYPQSLGPLPAGDVAFRGRDPSARVTSEQFAPLLELHPDMAEEAIVVTFETGGQDEYFESVGLPGARELAALSPRDAQTLLQRRDIPPEAKQRLRELFDVFAALDEKRAGLTTGNEPDELRQLMAQNGLVVGQAGIQDTQEMLKRLLREGTIDTAQFARYARVTEDVVNDTTQAGIADTAVTRIARRNAFVMRDVRRRVAGGDFMTIPTATNEPLPPEEIERELAADAVFNQLSSIDQQRVRDEIKRLINGQ